MEESDASKLRHVQILSTVLSSTSLERYEANSALSPSSTEACQFYMLSYHRDRILAAAQAFHWPMAVRSIEAPPGLKNLEDALLKCVHAADPATTTATTHSTPANSQALRIRIMLSQAGHLTLTSAPCKPISPSAAFPPFLSQSPDPATRTWRIQIATVPVPISPYTVHKTTFRTHYDAARSHLSSRDVDVEVLLANPAGELTEGSLSTPYFFREGRWITPAAECGGNQGTTRRWALEKGYCVEGVVRVEDAKVGEMVWLSNGVRGFGWGIVEAMGEDGKRTD